MSKIFVETRGISEVYNWFEALEVNKKQLPQLPELVKKLADTEFESLVLYRESRQLILAITALKSGRIDNRTRPIRNSLIWIADNDEEAKIRAIIYEYLTAKDGLEKDIADAITETPEIKIDYQKIESIGDNNLESNALNSARLICKIGNLDKYKQELIDEIKSCSLPKEKGLLVFIADNKSQKTFEEAKPWRGLSNNISSEGWIILENKNKKPVVNEKKTKKQTSQISTKSLTDSEKSLTKSNKTERKLLNIFSIILVLLLVSNAFLLYKINELEKKINQIENLQSVIDKSKTDVEKLTTNLENDIVTAKDKFEKAFMEAQKQFNDDIFKATSKYETEMAKVQQRLSDSIERIN
ncbi:hypothetical protein [Cyanobacterium aponinum]|uniref:Uncharacterized protein n=1 Tax=Cyanobacterium aponinum 0216 TaxID=2676140 RepID=A0A844H003_9CHRO|nr:hypothetical protein [Cyanobacterium aponinum]MTF40581.1 hypothetical protein [Cyanobacterium aponinum 0216]